MYKTPYFLFVDDIDEILFIHSVDCSLFRIYDEFLIFFITLGMTHKKLQMIKRLEITKMLTMTSKNEILRNCS